MTQFGRALAELNIDIVCANTPQAKGRVERANQTLQDRLVKELRLQGVSTLEAGNAVLPTCRDDFDTRFAREPRSLHDAHRPVRADEDLDVILTWQEERKLSKNLTLHYKRITCLVEPEPETLPRGSATRSRSSRRRSDSVTLLDSPARTSRAARNNESH